MRKRKVYFILGVVVLAGVLVAVFRREREPEYKGKPLSFWVRDLRAQGMPEGHTLADEAILHIGTNALPYLLKWIQYKQPAFKGTVYGAVNLVLNEFDPEWELSDEQIVRAWG